MTRELRPAGNRWTLGLCAGLLLLTSVGCAPIRGDGPVDGSGGGNSLQTALVATESWNGSEYSPAYLYLVDEEHTCQQILSNYGLAWWDLSNDTEWVIASVFKGQFVDWESTYRSQYSWNQSGESDYTLADFFNGSFGVGGYGSVGDDDDEIPPSPGTDPDEDEARDQQGILGSDQVTTEDSLTFTSWSEDTIRGSISSENGDWTFSATYCGDLPGEILGRAEDGGETVTDEP